MADTTQTTTQEVQQQTVDGKAAHGKPPQKSFTGDQINDSPSKSSNGTSSAEKDAAGSTGGRQRHGTNERKDAVPSSTGSQSDKTINGAASAHVANADDKDSTVASGGRTSPTRQQHAAATDTSGDSGSKKRSADQTTTGSDGRRSRNSGTASAAVNTSIGSGGHSDATVNDPEKSAEHDLAPGGGDAATKRAKIDTNADTAHQQKPPTIAGGDEDKGPISSSGTTGGHSAVAVDTPNLNKPHSDSDKLGGTHGGADAASSGGAVGSSGQA